MKHITIIDKKMFLLLLFVLLPLNTLVVAQDDDDPLPQTKINKNLKPLALDEFYSKREMQIAPALKGQLQKIRGDIHSKKLLFQVGYTTAMDQKLEELAGTKLPANLPQLAASQNQVAHQFIQLDSDARREFERLYPDKLPDLKIKPNAKLKAFDWRKHDKVTPVRNQRACGSCWAFTALGAYESSYLIRNNIAIDASEQYVLNCATGNSNNDAGSCAGGWWMPVFEYLIKHGVAKEVDAPYQWTDQPCNNTVATPYRAVAWGFVKPDGAIPSVAEMKQALIEYGPLAVAVRVTGAFQAYTGGVFNEMAAGSINHGVTLIGWDDNKGAWLIKNSWGTGWGSTCEYGSERGYMWITYGSNSIGVAAAWVRAQSVFYKLPDRFYKLLPIVIKPLPKPIINTSTQFKKNVATKPIETDDE